MTSPNRLKLPPCGIFIGSAIYVSFADYTMGTGRLFTCWVPEDHPPEWYLDKTVSENQGNIVQLWPNGVPQQLKAAAWWRGMWKDGVRIPDPDWKNKSMILPSDWEEIAKNDHRFGEGMVDFIEEAREKGIHTMVIYSRALPKYSQLLAKFGDWYLGHDCGECFTFRFDEKLCGHKNETSITLRDLANGLRSAVRTHCKKQKADGWGRVISTGVSFAVDYEVDEGLEIPLFEDYAENLVSGLCRGLQRQYDLPAWGTHMNHEWYSWLPYSCHYRMDSFRSGMYIKYMSGSKILINECGNWYLQSNLCQDSPMITHVPKLHGYPSMRGLANDFSISADYVEEARKGYPSINYDCEIAKRYRKEISDFYDYVKANGTPAGQPEAGIAIAKGNLDLYGDAAEFNPNVAIAGAYTIADKNPNWFASAPERGWDTIRRVFFPRPNVTGQYYNRYLSGTPFGPVDVVSFAGKISAEFLLKHYKTLIFSGWNTGSAEQYQILLDYVKAGGRLFLAIPHLSTNDTRDFNNYSASELVNGGDFTELCGLRVKGRGKRFYWATCADHVSEFEFPFPRRFGIMSTCLGDVEITGQVETLLVEDEEMDPILFRHPCGKGEVYFLNSWSYPGALAEDKGPGAEVNSPGIIGYVFKMLANKSRGTVFVTDDGFLPKTECEFIMFSYFPEDGSVCLMNIDFDHPHSFRLHLPTEVQNITLQPSEFRQFKIRHMEQGKEKS